MPLKVSKEQEQICSFVGRLCLAYAYQELEQLGCDESGDLQLSKYKLQCPKTPNPWTLNRGTVPKSRVLHPKACLRRRIVHDLSPSQWPFRAGRRLRRRRHTCKCSHGLRVERALGYMGIQNNFQFLAIILLVATKNYNF